MLPMLGIVLMLRPDEKLGVRVGDGSSRSRPGVLGSSSSKSDEKGECDMPKKCGVVGDGVAVVVAEAGVSPLKKARSNRWSSAVAVGERNVGRLILLYERGRKPEPEDAASEEGGLGRSTCVGEGSVNRDWSLRPV
jgi:hypothetical protein